MIWEEMYGSGLQSLVLARSVRTRIEEAVTTAASLFIQQVTVVTVRTVRTLTSGSGALYICRPEPWLL